MIVTNPHHPSQNIFRQCLEEGLILRGGHRGNPAYGENTEVSFNMALEQGADYLETDIQLVRSKFGGYVPILFHDDNGARVLRDSEGKPVDKPLTAMFWEEIQDYTVVNPSSLEVTQQRVLSLCEYLRIFGERTLHYLELKLKGDATHSEKQTLVDNTISVLNAHNLYSRIMLVSYDHETTQMAASFAEAHNIPMGRNFNIWDEVSEILTQDPSTRQISTLCPDFENTNANQVRSAIENGFYVIPYTPNSKVEFETILDWQKNGVSQVNGITTNRLDVLNEVLKVREKF
ncbi:glycerophosphodiester phosphodiesterase [bacterium]|jgi:glycerophosphoryl diester phosphodiesterase|nr:glycerophosphodiester phosphodiesterase [bacterium]